MKAKSILSMFLTCVSGMVLCGCSGHDHDDGHDGHDEHDAGESHSGSHEGIVVSEADAKRFGVEVEATAITPFANVVKVSGEVLPMSADKVVVSAPTAGIVTLKGELTAGSEVSKGQAVATVSARGVSGGEADRVAYAALEGARREVERVTPLLKQGLVTRKEYNDALTALAQAEAAYSVQAASGVARAGKSGVVVSVLVNDGEYVSAGQPLAEIASTGRLTLRALLPAKDKGFLPQIRDAVITPHDGEPVRLSLHGGKLVSASRAASVSTPGYIPVYFEFDGSAAHSLVAGNAVEVYLSSAPDSEALTVPAVALYEQLGQKFVFVKRAPALYEKLAVTVTGTDGIRAAIAEGLAEGDSVVTGGVTFVRLAEQATVVPEGHSHNH